MSATPGAGGRVNAIASFVTAVKAQVRAERERDQARAVIARVEAVAAEWGVEDSDGFAEAIRDSGAWRFARDLLAALHGADE